MLAVFSKTNTAVIRSDFVVGMRRTRGAVAGFYPEYEGWLEFSPWAQIPAVCTQSNLFTATTTPNTQKRHDFTANYIIIKSVVPSMAPVGS